MTDTVPTQAVDWCYVHRAQRASTSQALIVYCWKFDLLGAARQPCAVLPSTVVPVPAHPAPVPESRGGVAGGIPGAVG